MVFQLAFKVQAKFLSPQTCPASCFRLSLTDWFICSFMPSFIHHSLLSPRLWRQSSEQSQKSSLSHQQTHPIATGMLPPKMGAELQCGCQCPAQVFFPHRDTQDTGPRYQESPLQAAHTCFYLCRSTLGRLHLPFSGCSQKPTAVEMTAPCPESGQPCV